MAKRNNLRQWWEDFLHRPEEKPSKIDEYINSDEYKIVKKNENKVPVEIKEVEE